MIQIKIGNLEISGYITNYNIAVSPVDGGNTFEDINGNIISDIRGYKTTISCNLEKVPHNIAQSIAALTSSENEVTYTTPAELSGRFRFTKYTASPKNGDPRQKNPLITDNITWNISLTLESVNYGTGGGL